MFVSFYLTDITATHIIRLSSNLELTYMVHRWSYLLPNGTNKDFLISLPFQNNGRLLVFFAVTGVEKGRLFTDLLVGVVEVYYYYYI